MKRVFVSYSRNNLEVVTQLIADLEAVGVSAWHDQTLTGGQRWWDNILSNIRECDIFIFALSPESWDSEACRSELSYVAQLGKTILPVLVADGINLNLLPYPLHEIQVADYRRRDKEAAFALVKSINTAPANRPLPETLPAPPPVPVSYLSTLRDRIEASESLSPKDQMALLFELQSGIRDGRSGNEIRDLLLRLKRRDDLLAKVDGQIDAALKELDNRSHPPVTEPPKASPKPAAPRPAEAPRADAVRYCGQCRRSAPADAKFCGGCGAALGESGGSKAVVPVAEPHGPTVARSKSRRYACSLDENARIISDVTTWLDAQGFDSQQMPTEVNSVLLQVKKRGGWRDFVGMSTSLNIVFHESDEFLTVEIGAGKWLDKAAVGTVSMVILWPLAVTAGFGAWEQMRLPDRIFEYVGTRLAYR